MATNNEHVNNHMEIGDNDLDTVDDTPEKAHEFICRLVENGADNGYLLRGPYLARFELCCKLAQKNIDTTDLLGETTELFIEYFRKFGHKPCCVSDLKIYLNLLDGDRKAELAARLMKDIGISETSVPNSVSFRARVNCFYFQKFVTYLFNQENALDASDLIFISLICKNPFFKNASFCDIKEKKRNSSVTYFLLYDKSFINMYLQNK